MCFDVTNPTSFENVLIKVLLLLLCRPGRAKMLVQEQRNKYIVAQLEFQVCSSVSGHRWLSVSGMSVFSVVFKSWLTYGALPACGLWPHACRKDSVLSWDFLTAAMLKMRNVLPKNWILKLKKNVTVLFLPSGIQKWSTSVRMYPSSWLAVRLTSGRIKSVQGSWRPWIWIPSLTHR